MNNGTQSYPVAIIGAGAAGLAAAAHLVSRGERPVVLEAGPTVDLTQLQEYAFGAFLLRAGAAGGGRQGVLHPGDAAVIPSFVPIINPSAD